jgi:hypothetical protein
MFSGLAEGLQGTYPISAHSGSVELFALLALTNSIDFFYPQILNPPMSLITTGGVELFM